MILAEYFVHIAKTWRIGINDVTFVVHKTCKAVQLIFENRDFLISYTCKKNYEDLEWPNAFHITNS